MEDSDVRGYFDIRRSSDVTGDPDVRGDSNVIRDSDIRWRGRGSDVGGD